MTFRPLEFVGYPLLRFKNQPWGLFGYQGIIPTKAEKMASVCFDLMTTKLLNLKEIFNRLDPKKFGEVMEDALLLMLDTVVSEVAMKYMPGVWNRLPKEVKDELIVVMNIESESFLVGFMEEIKEHIEIYNAGDDGPLKFEPQDRKKGEEHLKTRNYYHYYELDFGLLFVISKMTVVE